MSSIILTADDYGACDFIDNGIIRGTILRINETLTMVESTALYYGELYVDQMPQYWDATYYVNEQIF